MSRLIKRSEDDGSFDIEFWQKAGPTVIFESAWEMVVTAASIKGISIDELRLDRSIANLERKRR